MKTKMFISLGALVIAAILFFNFTLTNDNQGNSSLSVNNLIKIAQADSEGCLTTPGSDTGICKKSITENMYYCVECEAFCIPDCSGD